MLDTTLAATELDEPAELKTTIFAVEPEGTVTTQKLAPPAPAAAVELVTPPIPSVEGSIEQGSPLQPVPEQVTLIPHDGFTVEKPESM